jgi:osmoprotectant transport system permease protein
VREQLALLPEYLTAHLQLTLVALLLGIGVSVPLGVLITRLRRLEAPVMGIASIIQTIPSLALLAFMVPVLAALHLQSIGYLPAIIGLWLYSMLPILRNTVTGISGVDPALIEAALGVGMTPAQRLRRVELPLAMPVIVAGIRTSTVWTVGIATLSTPVGATSLGNYIFSGLQTRNYGSVLVGCIAAAALAMLLDGLVRALETALRRRRRAAVVIALAAFGVLYAYTGASFVHGAAQGTDGTIRIGAKTFTEQYILSEILAQRIRRKTGLRTEAVQSLGSTVAFDALRAGEIDAYVDYSGTIWTTLMRRNDGPAERKIVLGEVERYLEREHGITMVAALGFENTYALAMREQDAQRYGIRRISDLSRHSSRMSIGGDYEFFGRPEWRAVRDTYGLEFEQKRSMDASLMYQAARQGDVDVITAFSTDGRIVAFGLRVLEDDRSVIPPYDALILVRPSLVDEHPNVVETLRALANTIDADRMRRMNQAVDEHGQTAATVAEAFLRELSTETP